MKKILCYGDSNTWGDPPGSIGRFPINVRWTGVLQQKLGKDFQVIEAGRCGRTTSFDDPTEADLNGLVSLPEILETYSPIDLLVIMLGTNDLKDCFQASVAEITNGIEELIQIAENFKLNKKQILVTCPAPITATNNQEVSALFSKGLEKSKDLASAFKLLCQKQNCSYLDAGDFIESSSIDGIHLDEENHERLATALHIKISQVLALDF